MLYEQFQQNIEKLIGDRPQMRSIALAVSGGSDSIALLMLTHKWVSTNSVNKNIYEVEMLVDHHLRKQSRLEHEYVRDLSHKLGHEYIYFISITKIIFLIYKQGLEMVVIN